MKVSNAPEHVDTINHVSEYVTYTLANKLIAKLANLHGFSACLGRIRHTDL